ncbi:glycoside hydrolase family 1 protein [Enterococcus sp. LJL99]
MARILWGGATASSQYEGGFDGEKGMDTQDCRPYLPRTSNATTATRLLTQEAINQAKDTSTDLFYPFRKGSEGIKFVEEDLALLSELGIDLYRFSISWARLFPNGDELEPNETGVEYYDKVFKKLKENNMKVFLTMNHYAVPLNIVETYGGWKNKETIELYLRFADFVLKRWGEYVDYWLPFNEINAGYFSPFNGVGLIKPKEENYSFTDVFQSLHHQFVASAKTIKLGRKLGVKGAFGSMISCFCYYPLTPKPEDNLKVVQDEQVNQWFCMDVLSKGYYPYYMTPFFEKNQVVLDTTQEELALLKKYTCDFVSFSYYSSSISTMEEDGKQTAGNLVVTTKNPYLEASEWGWQIDSIGLRTTLNKVYDRYQKPVIISENGFGAVDTLEDDATIHDPYRIEYFAKHFAEILKAKSDGVDIKAYIAWGIIDIVSAGSCEMAKRYGVVYVDADSNGEGSYKRYKKDSFTWYQNFIQQQKISE